MQILTSRQMCVRNAVNVRANLISLLCWWQSCLRAREFEASAHSGRRAVMVNASFGIRLSFCQPSFCKPAVLGMGLCCCDLMRNTSACGWVSRLTFRSKLSSPRSYANVKLTTTEGARRARGHVKDDVTRIFTESACLFYVCSHICASLWFLGFVRVWWRDALKTMCGLWSVWSSTYSMKRD